MFVDQAPFGRTDSHGALSLVVEAKLHNVRVEKTGYQTPPEQQVRISKNAPQSIAFTLTPQAAKLELRGAPAGVEVRSGAAVIGRTDGSPFSAPLPPGDHVLRFTAGSASREVSERFEPGRVVTLDWPSVAPAVNVTPAPPVVPVETPPVVRNKEVEPPAPSAAPPLPPIVNCHAAEFHGVRRSTVTWSGDLAPNATLVLMRGRGVIEGGGKVKGELPPGCDVDVTTPTPGITMDESPSAANNFARIKLRNTSAVPISVITIRWSAK